MASWVNRTVGVAARNGTSGHTITFAAASSGGLLVVLMSGSVTHTMSTSGYTKRLSAVNFTELAVWTKTASAGESSLAVTHNASNYPVEYAVYEFPAGSTWVNGTAFPNTNTWSAAVTGLSGSANTIFGAISAVQSSSVGATVITSSSTAPWVEDYDDGTVFATTEGANLAIQYQDNYATSSFTPNATSSATNNQERAAFAVAVAAVTPTIAPAGLATGEAAGTPTIAAGAPPPTFVAGSSASTGTGTATSLTVPLPTGTLAGHLCLVTMNTGTGSTLTGPTGWTSLANVTASTNAIGIWSKVLDSSDVSAGSVTVGRAVAAALVAQAVTIANASGVDQVVQGANSTTTTVVAPAVTPLISNCMELIVGASRITATATNSSHTPATGFTSGGESLNTTSSNRRLAWVDYLALSGQGGVAQPTYSETLTAAGASTAFSITIAPSVVNAIYPTGLATGQAFGTPQIGNPHYEGANDFEGGGVPFDTTVNPSTVESAAGYTGNGLHVATANAVTRNRWSDVTFGANKSYGAITFRLRFRTLPLAANLGGTDASIMGTKNSTASTGTGQGHFGMFFHPATNKLRWDGLASSSGESTMTFVAGQWYYVQAKFFYDGGAAAGAATYTADIKIDGITQTSIVSTGLNPYFVKAMGFGSDQTNQTYDYDVDDVLFGADVVDFGFLGQTAIAPTGAATGEAAGAPTIAPGPATASPSGAPSGETSGNPTIAAGAATVSASGLATGEAVGGPSVVPGPATVSPAGLATGEAFGTAATSRTVPLQGLASGETAGAPTISPAAANLAPLGVGSGEAAGLPVITASGSTVVPTGLPSGEAAGTPTITPGPVTLAPVGLASAVAIGAATVTATGAIAITGLATGEQAGAPSISAGPVTLAPAGVATGLAFGTLTTGLGLAPTGLASAAATGTPSINLGALAPTGLATGFVSSVPVLVPAPVTLVLAGLASGAAVGAPVLTAMAPGRDVDVVAVLAGPGRVTSTLGERTGVDTLLAEQGRIITTLGAQDG